MMYLYTELVEDGLINYTKVCANRYTAEAVLQDRYCKLYREISEGFLVREHRANPVKGNFEIVYANRFIVGKIETIEPYDILKLDRESEIQDTPDIPENFDYEKGC